MAHENAVHNDVVADGKVSHGELVFGWDVLWEDVTLACEFDLFTGFQIGKGDQNIVARIKLENRVMHRGFRQFLWEIAT
ncbi:MAG: hypothetical protein ABSG72_05375 [Candidatus Sulfotelmatobacter sp.]